MTKKRINVTISSVVLELLEKHFPNPRERSKAIEQCILKFDEDNITLNEIKFHFKRLSKDKKNI